MRHHPGAADPGRVMARVLEVAAFQLRDPVVFLVLVKAGNAFLHGGYRHSLGRK